MAYNFISFIKLIIGILQWVFLFKIYKDTENDPFQYKFSFEEKKNLFDKTNQAYSALPQRKICLRYEALIMDPETEKLGDVFELNIGTINICAYITILLLAFSIFIVVFDILCFLLFAVYSGVLILPISLVLLVFNCIAPFLLIASFISIIILIYNYFAGEINDYYAFLACPNINYDSFQKYKSVENLNSDCNNFLIFFTIQFVFIILFPKNSTNERN